MKRIGGYRVMSPERFAKFTPELKTTIYDIYPQKNGSKKFSKDTFAGYMEYAFNLGQMIFADELTMLFSDESLNTRELLIGEIQVMIGKKMQSFGTQVGKEMGQIDTLMKNMNHLAQQETGKEIFYGE